MICVRCNGTGKVGNAVCSGCNGKKKLTLDEFLKNTWSNKQKEDVAHLTKLRL